EGGGPCADRAHQRRPRDRPAAGASPTRFLSHDRRAGAASQFRHLRCAGGTRDRGWPGRLLGEHGRHDARANVRARRHVGRRDGGSAVLVLAGDETARAIARSGLRLESARYGTFEATPRTATELEHQVEACLITVKATQLDEALDRVPAGKLGHGLVIPFLNGLEHVDLLRDVYPPERVVPATIRIETARVAPGVVRHTSPFAGVDIAYTPGNREAVEEFAARLRDTGVDVRLREDEVAM